MLKQPMSDDSGQVLSPAAFGRLCVETFMPMLLINFLMPAAFGRLCVETTNSLSASSPTRAQPPSGGCVLKQIVLP